jgi:hypothetical protein
MVLKHVLLVDQFGVVMEILFNCRLVVSVDPTLSRCLVLLNNIFYDLQSLCR